MLLYIIVFSLAFSFVVLSMMLCECNHFEIINFLQRGKIQAPVEYIT